MESINKQELMDALKSNGLDPSNVENFNVAEIEQIVSSCNSVEEAIQKICEKNPQADAESIKKLLEDMQKAFMAQSPSELEKMSDEFVDLEDGDLEAVAGGSVGSWFKKNWPTLVTIAAIGGLCYGGYRYFKGSSAAGTTGGAGGTGTGTGETGGETDTAGKTAGGTGGGSGAGMYMALFGIQAISQSLMNTDK